MKVKVNTNSSDCSYVENIICPYCGQERDTWEHSRNEEVVTCGSCGRDFGCTQDIEITYSSYPLSTELHWENGDVFDDGVESEEDEKWCNEHGKKPCEVIR